MNAISKLSIFRTALLLSLVLSLGLSGCAAVQVSGGVQPQVAMLGAGETIRGLQGVIAGLPGTFAMVDSSGELILMAWPKGSNYAFTLMTSSGKAVDLNAVRIECLALAGSVRAMQGAGWKLIASSEIPAALGRVIMGYTVEMVVLGMRSLPTILLMPVILVNPDNRT